MSEHIDGFGHRPATDMVEVEMAHFEWELVTEAIFDAIDYLSEVDHPTQAHTDRMSNLSVILDKVIEAQGGDTQ